MAITVGIFGKSGDGKTTSLVINPNGTYNPSEYAGIDSKTSVFINSDKKKPPFPLGTTWIKGKNYFETSDIETISTMLNGISSKGTEVKRVFIDTINGIMLDYEMLESKKLTFDKWADLAKGVYEMISISNGLRDDLVIYFMGHVTNYTDVDGNESKCLITNGRKLEKIKLESKLPVVLFTTVERGSQGDNKYYFETQQNRSTGKSPLGMFPDFLIPNSIALVDARIREYYGI